MQGTSITAFCGLRKAAAIGDSVRRDKEIETREKRRAQGVVPSLVTRAVRSAIDGLQRQSVTNPVAGLAYRRSERVFLLSGNKPYEPHRV